MHRPRTPWRRRQSGCGGCCRAQGIHGRVGERRGLRDGCVVALIMTIGGEGIEVEGDQRSARRLCAPHALDGGMETRDRRTVAGYKTDALSTLARRSESRPYRTGGRPIVDADVLSPLALKREDNTLVL